VGLPACFRHSAGSRGDCGATCFVNEAGQGGWALSSFSTARPSPRPRVCLSCLCTLLLPAGDNDWWKKYKIHLGEGYPEGVTGSYTEVLAASTLCFVLPGDGFSPRFEDAVHHGWVGWAGG
jgi:hypothetical protein